MKLMLSIFSILFAANSLNAQSSAQLRDTLSNYNRASSELQTMTTESSSRIKSLEDRSAQIHEWIKENEAKAERFRKDGAQIYIRVSEATRRRDFEAARNLESERQGLLDKIREVQGHNERFKRELDNLNGELDRTRSRHSNALRQLQRVEGNKELAQRNWDNMYSGMMNEMSAASLSQKIQNLRYKSLEYSDNIMVLEKVYDNALLGNYIREKLTDLANSKSFCEASKQCTSQDKPNGIQLNEIFNEGNSRASSGQGASNRRRTSR